MLETTYNDVMKASDDIKEYTNEAADINMKEEKVGNPPTKFPKLERAQAAIKPLEEFWTLTYEWDFRF